MIKKVNILFAMMHDKEVASTHDRDASDRNLSRGLFKPNHHLEKIQSKEL